MNSPDYFVIPKDILKRNLTYSEIVIFGIIVTLSNSKGYCWASNSYISDLIGMHKVSVSKHLSKIKNLGLIEIDYTYNDSKKIESRYIKPKINLKNINSKNNNGGLTKEQTGINKTTNTPLTKEQAGINKTTKGNRKPIENRIENEYKRTPQKFHLIKFEKESQNLYNANTNQILNLLEKYGLEIQADLLNKLLWVFSRKELFKIIAKNNDKDLNKHFKENELKKLSKYWIYFAKNYPKKDYIIEAKRLFNSYDDDKQKKIADSVSVYKAYNPEVKYLKKALDYLETETWKEYAV